MHNVFTCLCGDSEHVWEAFCLSFVGQVDFHPHSLFFFLDIPHCDWERLFLAFLPFVLCISDYRRVSLASQRHSIVCETGLSHGNAIGERRYQWCIAQSVQRWAGSLSKDAIRLVSVQLFVDTRTNGYCNHKCFFPCLYIVSQFFWCMLIASASSGRSTSCRAANECWFQRPRITVEFRRRVGEDDLSKVSDLRKN